MIFGSTVLGADELTIPDAPTNLHDIYFSIIKDAVFNDFYYTNDTEYTITENVPMDWDDNTILHAKYDINLTAGTVDFEFDSIAGGYLVVRRKSIFNDYWITLHAYYIRTNKYKGKINGEPTYERYFTDCLHDFIDYTCAPGIEYQYALVPYFPNTLSPSNPYDPVWNPDIDPEDYPVYGGSDDEIDRNIIPDNMIEDGVYVQTYTSPYDNSSVYNRSTNIVNNRVPTLYAANTSGGYDTVNFTEGNYYVTKITPTTEMLVICTANELWATIYTDGFCDNQRNVAPGTVNTLNDKYPTFIDNSIANYETVNVTGQFYEDSEDSCLPNDSPENAPYNMLHSKKFKDFLMNRKPKFLKNIDGRTWFCYVTTPPSDNARDNYWTREVTFGVTELADIEDEEHLYDAKFITAGKEWWNK